MLPTNPLLNATAPAGPHLPVALLRQYAAGTLAPAAQHRVEAHTLACPRCADILAGLLQTPTATTDQALAQLQQRLRQRVQQVAPARQLAAVPRRHRWLAPQLAAAAALILGLVAAGWWTWQQRHHTPATVAAQYPAAPTEHQEAPATPTSPIASAKQVPIITQRASLDTKRTPVVAKSGLKSSNNVPARAKAELGAHGRMPATPKNEGGGSSGQPVAYSDATSAAGAALGAATDSAVPARSEVAGAPLAAPAPLTARAPAQEPIARLRATMPAPPALRASPTGGYTALREYLKTGAAEFEPESRAGGRQHGRVLVRLHLGADGKIEQAEAVRKLRPDYDAEAIRLLQEGPAWMPGIMAGRRAAQVVDVPVVFE